MLLDGVHGLLTAIAIGPHTAGILIHPTIYQFIREADVGGTHRFVFGKHSGAGAVEEALTKHQAVLEAQGMKVDGELVASTLEKVKELRARMVEDGHAARTIRQHYDNLAHLGISEEGLIELALTMNAANRAGRVLI